MDQFNFTVRKLFDKKWPCTTRGLDSKISCLLRWWYTLHLILGIIAAIAWPATLLSASSVIDNPWSVCTNRTVSAGRQLAEVLLARQQVHRVIILYFLLMPFFDIPFLISSHPIYQLAHLLRWNLHIEFLDVFAEISPLMLAKLIVNIGCYCVYFEGEKTGDANWIQLGSTGYLLLPARTGKEEK